MREQEFKNWLKNENYAANTITSQLTRIRKIEGEYGDVDALFDDDACASLLQQMRYSTQDEKAGRPNPTRLALWGNTLRDLRSLSASLGLYCRFRKGESRIMRAVQLPDRPAVLAAIDECMKEGVAGFLETYGFSPKGIKYFVVHEGKDYPSKVIFAVAHQYMEGGVPLNSKNSNGSIAHEHLASLGFPIVKHGVSASEGDAQEDDEDEVQQTTRPVAKPTNLILYGPPGTGKTYRTAAAAVKICKALSDTDPLLHTDSRDALMDEYKKLVDANRIEFVTFHQSTSYEEFVEGLRPVQGGGESGEAADGDGSTAEAGGFTLEPQPGIFKRISRRAQSSTRRAQNGTRSHEHFTLGARQVFKLSIGVAADRGEDKFYEEAMEHGRILLGYDDIDWTDSKFAKREAIIARCVEYDQKIGAAGKPPSAQSGRVQCPMIFRNGIKIGDLVVVSKGNFTYRAIGEVTGDYEYAPRAEGVFSHRRSVKWLWRDDEGASVDDIYAKNFSMRAVYELANSNIRVPALEQCVAGQQSDVGTAPEPFVLIIDEINRGNISRIFGELITLIEPDKRLGELNEVNVTLPYSRDRFGVPSNLHIIGTMNTADRSIALMDTALRRRFTFEEIAPDPSLLEESVDEIPLRRVLQVMNDRIEYLIDRDHRIGHAFFLGCDSAQDVHDAMRNKVIPLLQEFFFEDWSLVAAVLGELPAPGAKKKDTGFLTMRCLSDPTGNGGEDRYSWEVRDTFTVGAYLQLLGDLPAQTAEPAHADVE